MESPSVFAFAYFFLSGPQAFALPPFLLFLMWEAHYAQRTLVYPFLMRVRKDDSMPVAIATSGFVFNTINSYLNASWIVRFGHYPDSWTTDPRFLVGAAAFITGYVVNRRSDAILRNLRKPGETGYKIPQGGLYGLVSCPNYFGEIVIWTGWAVATWSLAGDDLKYATNKSGAWAAETVDSTGDVGWYTSIALDAEGKAHISYLDYTNYDLKYARYNGSTWEIETVDSAGDVGGYSSLALDAEGKVHISYYDYNNNDLKYVTNKSGPWVVDTVDSTSYSWDSLLYTSLALDEGIVHISYTEGVYDYSNHVWHYYIKYATNKNGAWVRTLVDSAGDGAGYSSLALDAEGMAHISYCDSTNHDLSAASHSAARRQSTACSGSVEMLGMRRSSR